MHEMILPIALVAGIGLLAAILLVVASKLMAVPVDEKAVQVRECLPGANCGACGFSGCDGYAAALSKGEAQNGLCTPGGKAAAEKIAALLGGEADVEEKYAVVRCIGSSDYTEDKMEYVGIKTCAAASLVAGGSSSCRFGCLGYGDCAAACPSNAIEVCNGVAHVKHALCTGCGICTGVCPRKIISVVPKKQQAVVVCSNCDRGPAVMKVCKVGCIGCGKCMKTCPQGAIKVENFCARVDPSLCTGCGACAEVCPRKCIKITEEA